MRIGVVVGEASGDQLGAGLIRELKKTYPDLIVEGIAGPKMISEGASTFFPMDRLSVMGFIEPLKRLPEIIKIRRTIISHFIQNPPDVFIGIDSPDFNLGIELKLRKKGIKTVHYVSPSVWAWRQWRIHKIKKACDLMLTLFPFEADFYRKHHVPVEFVGHPLADRIPLNPDINSAREKLHLEKDKQYLAILPGSRSMEIHYLAKPFILAAKKCVEKMPELQIIVAMVNEKRAEQFKTILNQIAPELKVQIFIQQSHEVMIAADVLLLGSGTVTLEGMLFKKPMVVAYKMSWFNFELAKRLIKIKYFSLPNLIAGESLVPELLQHDVIPDNLYVHLIHYFENKEDREKLIKRFYEIHQSIKQNADQKAAQAVLSILTTEDT